MRKRHRKSFMSEGNFSFMHFLSDNFSFLSISLKVIMLIMKMRFSLLIHSFMPRLLFYKDMKIFSFYISFPFCQCIFFFFVYVTPRLSHSAHLMNKKRYHSSRFSFIQTTMNFFVCLFHCHFVLACEKIIKCLYFLIM